MKLNLSIAAFFALLGSAWFYASVDSQKFSPDFQDRLAQPYRSALYEAVVEKTQQDEMQEASLSMKLP